MELWNYRPKIIIHGILFLVFNILDALLLMRIYSIIKHNLYDFLFIFEIIFFAFLQIIAFVLCFVSFVKFFKYEWLLDDNNYWKTFFAFIGIAALLINFSVIGCFANYLSSDKVTFGYSSYYLYHSDIDIFMRSQEGTVSVKANGNTFKFEATEGAFSSHLNELNISKRIKMNCVNSSSGDCIEYSIPYDDVAVITIYQCGSIFTSVYPDLNPSVHCLYHYDSSKFNDLYNLCVSLYENIPTQIE